MIAGAKVGVIDGLEVTDDLRAAVVLKIDDPGFQDFREDAECQIRLQSVIGEKLVECQPTQPRPEGEPPPPPLPKIPDGQDGAGQRLLPVEQTLTPVGEDLIRNVMRRPYRERFAIILNEFGAGLAGRGKDLRKVIRGANPALRELDKVLKILADQNRLLADGARSGDRVLAEWAKKRKNVSNADRAGEHRRPGDGGGAREPGEELRDVPGVPAGAEAHDGGARHDVGADDAGRPRPGRGRAPT